MEDVLDPVSSTGQAFYHEEYDRERPVVCFDESSKLDFTQNLEQVLDTIALAYRHPWLE